MIFYTNAYAKLIICFIIFYSRFVLIGFIGILEFSSLLSKLIILQAVNLIGSIKKCRTISKETKIRIVLQLLLLSTSLEYTSKFWIKEKHPIM
jgi:hypothetical protein